MHKTGTTAIQNFLYLNKSILIDNNLLYYSDVPIDYQFANSLKNKTNRQEVEEQIRKLKQTKEDSVLLSCEVFIEADHIPNLFHELFQQEGIYDVFDIRVVIYIRRQDKWLESSYLQVSKDLGWKSLSFDQYIIVSGLDDYLSRILIWESVFGLESIILKVYEKLQFKGSLFDDFFSIFGINITDDFQFPDDKLMNIGIDATLANIINHSKDLFSKQRYLDQFIKQISIINEDSLGNELLRLNQRIKILEKYDDYNKNIALKFLNRQNRMLFLEPIENKNSNGYFYEHVNKEAIRLLVKLNLRNLET